jgi:hypothetical protein
MAGHVWSDSRLCKSSALRCGQFLGAAILACGLYLLNLWSGDGVRLLVVLAATSALLYISLAVQSRTRALVLLNLFAVPILFATAYAGLHVATAWLIGSFFLHGSLIAYQLASVDKELVGGLFCWSIFNSAMALLLLLD